MFNSRKINNDPKPWYVVEADDGQSDGRYSQRQYEEGRDSPFHPYGDVVYNLAHWKPRPEYDNNPNPILARFREYVEERTDAALYYSLALVEDALTAIRYHEGEIAWKRGEDEGTDELFGALREFADNTSFTEHAEHIDHARRVLERLVNVYG